MLMQMEFIGVAIRGGNFYLHDVGTASLDAATSKRAARGGGGGGSGGKLLASSQRTLSDEEQERLVPLVSHLLELDQLGAVVEAWKEELQSILKQRVMDFVADLLAKFKKADEDAQVQAQQTVAKESTAASASNSEAENSGDDSNESKLSARDQVAADTLLGEAQPSPAPASASNNINSSTLAPPSSTPSPDASQGTPSPMPSITVSPATTTPSTTMNGPSSAAAPPSAAAAPHRRQPVVAMPVNQQTSSTTTTQAGTAPAPPASSAAASPAGTPSPSPNATGAAASPAAPATTPAPSPAAATPAAPSISNRLSSLPQEEFLALLLPMFSSLMDVVQRAGAVRHLALTVLANSPVPPAQKDALSRVLHDALVALVEFAHAKIAKILQTRAQVHAELELRQLRQFLDVILNFIQEGEKLAGKTFYGLRGTLLVQAKAFLAAFHAQSLALLGASLESEKWVRVDVPAEYQHLIDSHFAVKKETMATTTGATANASAGTSNKLKPSSSMDALTDGDSKLTSSSSTSSLKLTPSTWQNKSWNEAAAEDDEGAAASAAGAAGDKKAPAPATSPAPKADEAAAAAAASDSKRVLFVARPPANGAAGPVTFLRFPAVPSLLLLLKLLGQYVQCAAQLQAVGSDILNRLAELLQMFNSRSCQLVLGAGAMHLSGLKSVSQAFAQQQHSTQHFSPLGFAFPFPCARCVPCLLRSFVRLLCFRNAG
jgi:hypothetical protein